MVNILIFLRLLKAKVRNHIRLGTCAIWVCNKVGKGKGKIRNPLFGRVDEVRQGKTREKGRSIHFLSSQKWEIFIFVF